MDLDGLSPSSRDSPISPPVLCGFSCEGRGGGWREVRGVRGRGSGSDPSSPSPSEIVSGERTRGQLI